MNKKNIILYVCTILCLIMPVISIEGIIPWIVCLLIMHKNFKIYKEENNIKKVVANLVICTGVIIFYNVAGRMIQDVLVKLWV